MNLDSPVQITKPTLKMEAGVSLPLVSVLPGDDFRWSILSDPLTRERGYSDGSNVLVCLKMGAGVSLSLPQEEVHGACIFSLFFSLISVPFARVPVCIRERNFPGGFNMPDNESLFVLVHKTFLLRARVDLGEKRSNFKNKGNSARSAVKDIRSSLEGTRSSMTMIHGVLVLPMTTFGTSGLLKTGSKNRYPDLVF